MLEDYGGGGGEAPVRSQLEQDRDFRSTNNSTNAVHCLSACPWTHVRHKVPSQLAQDNNCSVLQTADGLPALTVKN